MFILTNILDEALKLLKQVPDGDFVDRLNYYWTSLSLSLLAYLLLGWTFYGKNIECWFPAVFSKNWQQYALDICFVQGTYYVPFFNKTLANLGVKQMQPVPIDPIVQDESSISYYQWAPMIICLQAVAFYAPIVIWRKLYENSDIPLEDICKLQWYKTARDEKEEDEETKKLSEAEKSAKQIETVTRLIAQIHETRCSMFRGSYLFLSYLFTKLLYILNASAQFFFLMTMFGASDYMWGWEMTKDIWKGIEPEESASFPRVTICQFTIRMQGEPATEHRVQCLLVINFLYEKIFLLQWYYLIFVFAVNAASLLWWTFSAIASQTNSGKSDRQRFEQYYLRFDGRFVLRLLALNHGDTVVRKLEAQLWKDFEAMRGREKSGEMKLLPIMKAKKPKVLEATV